MFTLWEFPYVGGHLKELGFRRDGGLLKSGHGSTSQAAMLSALPCSLCIACST